MASADITSIVIQAKSDGISDRTTELKNLTSASNDTETSVGKLNKTLSDSSSTSAATSAIDKLMVKYQAVADLIGTTTAQQYAYTAALKGGSDAQQSAAAFLGAEVDAYKALASAQAEGIAMNKALDKSYDSLSKQADAYYASQAKIAAAAQALNDAGYRAQEYAKLQDAMKALEQETNALAAAEAREKAIQQNRDIEMHTQQVRAYSAAQSEAIKMNNDLAAAEQRQAKASQEAFNNIGPTRATLDQANQSAQQWLNNLNQQADRAGLVGKALRDYEANLRRVQAAEMGVSDSAEKAIQKLQDTEKASGHASGGISGIFRELLVLGHEASQGQYTRLGGSMVVLAERADIAGKSVAFVTEKAATLGVSIATVLAPIAAIVAALVAAGAVVYNFYKSAQNYHELTNALILTNNYAGASADSLLAMARAATVAGGSVGEAKSAVLQLAESGKFTADQIKYITEAAVALEKSAGISTKETIKHFEDLATQSTNSSSQSTNAIAKDAIKLNDQYHYLTAGIYEQIVAFEKEGDAQTAISISLGAYADNVEKQAKKIEDSLSGMMKYFHTIHDAAIAMWDAISQKDSDAKLKAAFELNLKQFNAPGGGAEFVSADMAAKYRIEMARKIAEIDKRLDAQRTQDEADQQKQRLEQEKIHGQARMNALMEQYDKTNKATKDLAQFDMAWEKQTDDYKLAHFDEHMKARANIEEKTHEKIKKVKALGFADINLEISKIKEQTQAQIEADTLIIESAKNLYALKKIDILAEQQIIDTAIRHKIEVENTGYKKEQEAIKESMAVRGRTATEIKELQNRAVQDTTTHDKAVTSLNKALMDNSTIVEVALTKAYNDENTANQKVVDGLKQKTADLKAMNEAYEKLPESIRAAGVTDKQMQDAITQAKIDALTAENDALQKNTEADNVYTQQKIDNNKKVIEAMNDERAQQVIRESQQATNKAAQDYVTAWRQANKQIGDDLAAAIIDGGGKGWKKLIKDMEMAFAKMILRPVLEPISGAFASLTTTVGASSPGAVDGSGAVGLAATASKTYSALTGGIAGGLGAAATGIGNLIGSSAVSAFGAGLSGGSGVSSAVAAYTAAGQTATASALSLGSTVAAAIPWIAGAAGILGVLKFGFGMGSKETTSQGISGTVADSGVTGQSYQNWMQKGGWFRSDKHGQDTQALTTDVVNSFMYGLTSMKTSATDFAKNLNVSADSLKNYSKAFDITLTSDAAANQKAITEFFTTMGDDMAAKLVPNIADFAKQGETASITLQRLSDTFKTTNAVMDLFGINSEKVFGGLGLESAKARQYLVDLAGGISNLGSQATFYAQNFLNAQEQIAPVQKAVTNALDSLGLSKLATALSDTSLPASDLINKFKDIVNGLNLVDPAQAQLFESLMQLAPAFKQVTDAADAATKAAQDQAAASKQASLDSFKSLQSAASSDFDVLKNAIQTQKDAATAAYNTQAAILNAQISSLTTISQTIGELSTALDNALHTMTDNTVLAMTRAQAQAQLDAVLAEAKQSGKLPTAASMKDTLATLGKDPAASYSSYKDYVKDQAITANKISALNDLAKDQKTTAEQQLEVAKTQLDEAKKAYDAEMAKYDMMLNVAQQQLDAVNGVQVAVKDLASALASFNASSSKAISAGVSIGAIQAPQAATESQITGFYQNLLGRAPDAAGLAWWENQASHGATASQIMQGFLQSSEYATRINGSHANGLDNVPFDGYTAKLHKGEMVLPAKQAKGVIQGEDMKAVVDAINNLCADNSAENRSLVSDIKWLRKLFQNMAPSNDRLQVHDIGAA